MEQTICVQSDHRCRDSYSLPHDGQNRDDHCELQQAFRDAEPELVHCDVQLEPCGEQQVQDGAQRASTRDGQHRSDCACGCFHPYR